MADLIFSMWPDQSTGRKVVSAEAQVVDESEQIYQIAFLDSKNRKLVVRLPHTALRTLVQTGAALLGISLSP